MGLIVETGEGLPDANSYATATEADAYFDGMMETVWETATSVAKDAALIKATIYIDGTYQNRFNGLKKTNTQALEWPRVGATEHGYAIEDYIIPKRLKWATFQAALRALSGELAPDIKDVVTEIQVGPIRKVVAPGSGSPKYPVVEQLLRPILNESSAGQILVGR